MHTWQSKIRLALTAAIGSILIVFLLLWFKVVVLPRSLVFFLIVLLVLLTNLFWWVWVDGQLSRRSESASHRRRLMRILWAVYALAVLSPVALVMLGGRRLWDALPVTVIMWVLCWHMLMVFLSVVLAAAGLINLVFSCLRGHGDKVGTKGTGAIFSRRVLLMRSAVVAPAVIVGASVCRGFIQAGGFDVRRMTMELPRLPDRLRGLTITHLSDFHVGRLFRPEHLPAVVEAANGFGSDLVVITGDLVDHSNDFLPAAYQAISQLEHRYGRFMVVGNHDLIDSPRVLLSYLAGREPNLLCDQFVSINIGGEILQIAGLFWSYSDQSRNDFPGHRLRAARSLAGSDPDTFTVALAHHPHAFDSLAELGVDLTLAGHTHGGQIMLTPVGAKHPIGAGNLLFRYLRGEYRRGRSALYVNAGVGNWFPVRLNSPAEIVQIQLV